MAILYLKHKFIIKQNILGPQEIILTFYYIQSHEIQENIDEI